MILLQYKAGAEWITPGGWRFPNFPARPVERVNGFDTINEARQFFRAHKAEFFRAFGSGTPWRIQATEIINKGVLDEQ